MNHTRSSRIRTVGIAASLLLVAACSNDRTATPPPVDLDGVQLVAALEPFDACEDFLAYVKDEAQQQVGPYGLNGGGGVIAWGDDMVTAREGAPMTTAAGVDEFATESDAAAPSASKSDSAQATAGDSGSGSGTGTNNQEAGVDEADIVKTDGNRIVTVRGNQLIVVTMIDGAPHTTATVDLGDAFYGDKLFLLADRAYVLGNDDTMNVMPEGGVDAESSYYASSAAIVEVSLGETPAVAGRTSIEGMVLDGRMTNGALRLVLTTPGGAGLGFVYPSGGDSRSEDRAEEANRDVIAESTLEDWLPDVVDGSGKRSQLLDCDHLYRPAEVSGFSMLSILTISDGLGSLTGTGVLADGQVTYASTSNLYVATNAWTDPSATSGDDSSKRAAVTAEHTDVHAFSIAGTEPAAYEASGRVDGHVLNQYSMSESDGNLRIATTTSATWSGGGVTDCPADAFCAEPQIAEETPQGDSQIVVLGRDGDSLVELGKVEGLGVSEQIKSVRYVGDIAYVVTFRQTDPFYVVDLSDPSAPKKLGELKVPGFSSYLHPVGDGLVLGVGSEATDQGRITGAKLSLYRTTDPLNPTEVATFVSRDLGFMAGDDPHAFSWDAERQTAYLPYYSSCWDDMGNCGSNQNGVLVVKVTPDAITEVGRITHADRTPSPDVVPTPDTTVPETTVPGTTVPETTVPTTAPETTAPESTTIPGTTIPSTTVVAAEDDGTSSSSTAASPPADKPVPLPEPGITEPTCDPSFCDPGPVDYLPTITRVFVIGDRIITLSDAGIAAHNVADLKLVGFAAF